MNEKLKEKNSENEWFGEIAMGNSNTHYKRVCAKVFQCSLLPDSGIFFPLFFAR